MAELKSAAKACFVVDCRVSVREGAIFAIDIVIPSDTVHPTMHPLCSTHGVDGKKTNTISIPTAS